MENINKLSKNPFFDGIKKVHFIGIGGVSMSALARLSRHFGLSVTGSDLRQSKETMELMSIGIDVKLSHAGDNITNDIDLVVYSGAINSDNPEIISAVRLGIKTVERSVYLAQISKLYDYVIAVSGTHGKTTTTAILSQIFIKAKLDPTIHIGGNTNEYGNLRIGGEKVFITEACEYRNSMSQLKPNIAVVTNIDDDHLDYYKTRKNLIKAFQEFEASATDYSVVGSLRMFRKVNSLNQQISVGFSQRQNVFAKDLKRTKYGYIFRVFINGKWKKFKLKMYGRHNVHNALFAITVASIYGVKLRHIRRGLKSFKGLHRRYEKVCEYKDIPVLSDYAHHPTEIIHSLKGLSEHYKNILVVFQPHTYSRTRNLIKEFATCFGGAKKLILYPTYAAREKYDRMADENALYDVVTLKKKYVVKNDTELRYTINRLLKNSKIDLILFLGAGDICERIDKIIDMH